MALTTSQAIARAIDASPIYNRGIRWGPCSIETGGLPVQCGNLTVPLDYTNKSRTDTIELNLIKLPAKQQPAPKGSILLNFGGPGANGVESFISYVPLQGP